MTAVPAGGQVYEGQSPAVLAGFCFFKRGSFGLRTYGRPILR